MKPIWIELVNTGVANRFELEDHELIEMNWRLTMYPELYHQVFKHEMKHDEGAFKFSDLKHDMKSRTPGLFNFMSKHISSWTQLFPIYWDRKRKQIVYDWSNITAWWMLFGMAISVFLILDWGTYIWRNGIW